MSSSVPGFTTSIVMEDRGSFHTFVPHRGQPSIRTTRPLSAALSKAVSSPWSSSTYSRRIGMDIVWVPPLDRWQSLQWQL
jgi:hypothetical protein